MSVEEEYPYGWEAYAREDLEYFSRKCFPGEKTSEEFHKTWFKIAEDDSIRRAVNIAPRNSGKTTCWAKKAPLWMLGRNPNLKILLLGRAAEKAIANMRFIRVNVENNKLVQAVFPDLKPFGRGAPWGEEYLTVENTRLDGEVSVLARGLEGQIAGFRADRIFCDDLIDKTNVMTEGQRVKVKEFWNEIVFPTLNPDGRVFIIGSRYHNKDFYSDILRDPAYKEHVYSFPAFKMDEKGNLLLDKDGKPISYWPSRWTVDKLLDFKNEIGSIAFASQFLCDPSGFEGRLFNPDWIQYYDPYKVLSSKLQELEYIMAVDPNIKEDPKSDNTAIITIAVDRRYKEIYVLDYFAEPLDFIGQVKKIKELGSRLTIPYIPIEAHIRKIGVESTAYQKALQSTGYLMGLPVVEVQHSKSDKVTRILRIQPHIENGRIKFPDLEVVTPRWWDKFYEEYCTFPRGRRDDMMDVLEVAVEIAGVTESGSTIPFGPGGGSMFRRLTVESA